VNTALGSSVAGAGFPEGKLHAEKVIAAITSIAIRLILWLISHPPY
jgi:hypothetical protein